MLVMPEELSTSLKAGLTMRSEQLTLTGSMLFGRQHFVKDCARCNSFLASECDMLSRINPVKKPKS